MFTIIAAYLGLTISIGNVIYLFIQEKTRLKVDLGITEKKALGNENLVFEYFSIKIYNKSKFKVIIEKIIIIYNNKDYSLLELEIQTNNGDDLPQEIETKGSKLFLAKRLKLKGKVKRVRIETSSGKCFYAKGVVLDELHTRKLQ